MNTRERLLGISELNIAKILIKMNNGQLNKYVQELKLFVENFPSKESELKNALDEKDYLSFSKCFASIREILVKIYADDLAQECNKLINELVTVKHEKAEAHMTYLLSLLTMLSIDIQMAVYKDDDTESSQSESEPAEITETEEPQAKLPESEPENVKKSILAVDDKPFFLDTLKRVIQGTDFKITCVNSGMAALKFLENHTPDLFILDIEMPEMNGYELAHRIRDQGKSAPILFLTGNATKEYVTKAIEAGAADFIVKPITQKQVLDRIGKFI